MQLQASQPLRQTVVPRWSYAWPGNFFSRRWGNARWKARIKAWTRKGWRNWATFFLGICFQPWWQNSCFDPFSLLSTTCPLVQRWGGSQWVCCPWQPPACAHACSSFLPALPPVMGQGGNAKLCLQAAYLFHSPATLHLFRCCSGAYRGEIFSCLSIPEDVWVVGVFIIISESHFSTSYFIVL